MSPDEQPHTAPHGKDRTARAVEGDTIDAAQPRPASLARLLPAAGERGSYWRPAHRPMQTIPRQFRLLPEDDDLVVALHQYLGDDKLVESMRRFIRHCVPLVLKGEIVVPPSDRWETL